MFIREGMRIEKVSIISNLIKALVFLVGLKCPSYAFQCKNLFINAKIDNQIEALISQGLELEDHILPSVASVESLNLLNTYYNLIDPSLAFQNISATARQLYLSPLFNDPRLEPLKDSTKNRIEHFISRKLFRPKQAIVIAAYLNGEEQTRNLELIARELINLKAEELSLRKIRTYLLSRNSSGESPASRKENEAEAQRFLTSSQASWLKHRDDIPKNNSMLELNRFRNSLRYGPFVNDIIVDSYDDILRLEGFLIPAPLQK